MQFGQIWLLHHVDMPSIQVGHIKEFDHTERLYITSTFDLFEDPTKKKLIYN